MSGAERDANEASVPLDPPIPTLAETIRAWKLAGSSKHHLEDGFVNSPTNLGGAISESFENRIENMKRTTNTIIPAYNALADPHLKGFRRRWAKLLSDAQLLAPGDDDHFVRAAPPSRPASGKTRPASRSPERPHSSPARKLTSSDIIGVGGPVSTRHVLALKQLFWRWSTEFRAVVAPHLPGGSTLYSNSQKIRIVRVLEVNFHALVCAGIAATNAQHSLYQRLPLPSPSMALLYDWLVLLGCTETVDWPAFIILCCANLQSHWAAVATIRNNYDCFIQQRPIESERDFHELLAFLRYNSTSGTTQNDANAKIVSFFQPGDFFRARNIKSFAEAIIALMPHHEQSCIAKAKAQGQSLVQNFCGHTCVVGESKSTNASARRDFLKKEILTKREAEVEQAKRIRYNRKVWC